MMKKRLVCLFYVLVSVSSVSEETEKTEKTEIDLLEFFTEKEEERFTGFTCGTTEYSDWPCMDAEGCIVKEKNYEKFIDN